MSGGGGGFTAREAVAFVAIVVVLLAVLAGVAALIVRRFRVSYPLYVRSALRKRVLVVCGCVAAGLSAVLFFLQALSVSATGGLPGGRAAKILNYREALGANPPWLGQEHPGGRTWRERLEKEVAAYEANWMGVFDIAWGPRVFGPSAVVAAACSALCFALAFVRAGWVAFALLVLWLAVEIVTSPRHLSAVRRASTDSVAVAGLRAYLGAQNTFHRTAFYGEEVAPVYANPRDGSGFSDLYQVGFPEKPRGEEMKLIDVTFARARLGSAGAKPKAGYYFVDITGDAEGPYDFRTECGLCAFPAVYGRSGGHTYIVDVAGTVYYKDTAGLPVTVWPDAEKEGWRPVGSGD